MFSGWNCYYCDGVGIETVLLFPLGLSVMFEDVNIHTEVMEGVEYLCLCGPHIAGEVGALY